MPATTLERTVRLSLWVTAPFNLIAAYAFAFPDSGLGQLLGFPAMTHSLFSLFSGAMVGLFGLMYLWLARQPVLLKPVLVFGGTGKALAVLISFVLFLKGALSPVLMFVISGDLIFTVLWFTFVVSDRSK